MHPVVKYLLRKKHLKLASWVLSRLAFAFRKDQKYFEAIRKVRGAKIALDCLAQTKRTDEDRATIESGLYNYLRDTGYMPARKLKIAFCLSGDTRSFSACKESVEHFLQGHDVDVFAHCWERNDPAPLLAVYPDAILIHESQPDFTDLEKAGIEALGFRDFGDGIRIPLANPNIFPMWYGIKRSYDALLTSGKSPADYDIIIRSRYDNYFPKRLDCFEVNDDEILIDPQYGGYDGHGDQLAVGKPEAMDKYFRLYEWLNQSFTTDFTPLTYHPETLVTVYLERFCHLKVRDYNFDFRLLRDEFIGLPDHLIPTRSHKVSKSRNKNLSDYIKKKFPEYAEG